ncbi:MAG: DUF411 domain-containing protein [Pseudomonadota bacterium]
MRILKFKYLLMLCSLFLLNACGEKDSVESKESISSANSQIINTPEKNNTSLNESNQTTEKLSFQVYKSPTCGCCKAWIDHAEENGLQTKTIDTDELVELKAKLGIASEYRSCHTAVSDQGYVFEGHVPAKLVKRFLEEKPENALGLAVPGMPMGSPGMEVEDQFDPYDVVLLKKDGSSEVYARIATKEQQY